MPWGGLGSATSVSALSWGPTASAATCLPNHRRPTGGGGGGRALFSLARPRPASGGGGDRSARVCARGGGPRMSGGNGRVALYLQDKHPVRDGMTYVRYAEERGVEAVWQGGGRAGGAGSAPRA